MTVAAEKWRAAKVAVTAQNVVRQFHTLRDMDADVGVPFDKLEYAGVLGEGAFGEVERRRYTDASGRASYYAVKHLKQQDVQLEGEGSSKAAQALRMMCALAADAAVVDQAGTGVAKAGTGAPPAMNPTAAASLQEFVATMPEEDRMFMAEIGLMRKLSHPYIVRYLGCGVISAADGPGGPQKHFIAVAQEVCNGGSLSTTINRAATMTIKRLYAYSDALRWATQVARALQYLHESQPQVLHRDLKAENVLLTQRGRGGDVRVMDFGLVKLRKMARGSWKEDSHETANYRMTGVTGSFLYMAPEVVRSEPYNEKVDIFSLGVIMYELFTMMPLASIVSKSGDVEEFEAYARSVAAGHREELPGDWPQQLKDIISGCWAADPHKRLSAQQAVHLLLEAQAAIDQMDADCPRAVAATLSPNLASSGSCCVIS